MNTALVTGANKGIGYEVARQLAGKGFQVFVGARNRDAGQKAVAKIAKEGGKAIFLEIAMSQIIRALLLPHASLPKLPIIWMCS